MPSYAHCPDCDHRFETRGVVAINSHGTMLGVETKCPNCGSKRARMMEGTFHFDGTGQVTVLSGPQWSRDLVQQMQGRMRQIERIAQSQRLTDDEARQRIEVLVAEVEEMNPAVAAEYRKITSGKPRPAWKTAAIAVGAVLGAIGTINTVADFSDRVADLLRYFGWAS